MRLIFRYMRERLGRIGVSMTVKTAAALGELMIPYILEHMIDDVVPRGEMSLVVLWGLAMVLAAVAVRQGNVFANRAAVAVARDCAQSVRQDLFVQTTRLSGSQIDRFGLPSLISRMTSDSYNVQTFIRAVQTLGVRAPILLVGGIAVTMTMDAALASILCVMAPVLVCVVIFVSWRGIPLYDRVQRRLDTVVRIMRENISGIRVVKALSKTEYEKRRFRQANGDLTRDDLKAGVVMAIPGPTVQLCLNIGLVLVVVVGARRVDAGQTEPGVILAFLTYFTMILQSVMALNRVFIMLSKASASARRIAEVIETVNDQPVLPLTEERRRENGAVLEFDHVSFTHAAGGGARAESFAGGQREKSLDDVSFRLERGQTMGLIGATGAGKTTVVDLLMRFYDAGQGGVYVDGRDVRTYDKDQLRRRFGVAMQNDMIFADTLEENISMGRPVTAAAVRQAAEDAMAAGFIDGKAGRYQYRADIRGANLSGGQKQRLLIARALAARPEILILDDATSALDYRTDAAVRRNIREGCGQVTSVIVAQRISSILSADLILVLEEGRVIGQGTHQELLKTCPVYLDIYQSQMGELA